MGVEIFASFLRKTLIASSAAFWLSVSLAFAQSKPAEWERIVEAAKKEGKVVASIPPSPELRKGMEVAFTRRYGIAVEFVPARGGAIVQRMDERRDGGLGIRANRSKRVRRRLTQFGRVLVSQALDEGWHRRMRRRADVDDLFRRENARRPILGILQRIQKDR